jgi:hypothetical protein
MQATTTTLPGTGHGGGHCVETERMPATPAVLVAIAMCWKVMSVRHLTRAFRPCSPKFDCRSMKCRLLNLLSFCRCCCAWRWWGCGYGATGCGTRSICETTTSARSRRPLLTAGRSSGRRVSSPPKRGGIGFQWTRVESRMFSGVLPTPKPLGHTSSEFVGKYPLSRRRPASRGRVYYWRKGPFELLLLHEKDEWGEARERCVTVPYWSVALTLAVPPAVIPLPAATGAAPAAGATGCAPPAATTFARPPSGAPSAGGRPHEGDAAGGGDGSSDAGARLQSFPARPRDTPAVASPSVPYTITHYARTITLTPRPAPGPGAGDHAC